jgi:hypothetical protein
MKKDILRYWIVVKISSKICMISFRASTYLKSGKDMFRYVG